MLLKAKTVLFRAKSLVACRERLVELQCLLGNHFVKKSPRGDPRAGQQRNGPYTTKRRTAAAIAKSAAKELQSLAEFMPNLADTDARTLALRLYYIELADGVSPIRARNKVSQMFLVSVITVKRWSSSWEANGKQDLFDYRT